MTGVHGRHRTLGSVMGNTDRNTGRRPGGWWPRVVLLAIALASVAPARARTVSDDTDRISGERTIAYIADGSRDLARPVFTFNASSVGGEFTSGVNLAFVSGGDGASPAGPRFAACHDIEWFVDGAPLAAGRASHRDRVIDGETIEMIDQEVTSSWVTAIGRAQTVRYRVCRDEFALSPNDIDAFSVIASKLTSPVISPAAPRASAPSSTNEVEYKGMNWRPKNQGTMFPSRN